MQLLSSFYQEVAISAINWMMFTTVHQDFVSSQESCNWYHKAIRNELVSHYRMACQFLRNKTARKESKLLFTTIHQRSKEPGYLFLYIFQVAFKNAVCTSKPACHTWFIHINITAYTNSDLAWGSLRVTWKLYVCLQMSQLLQFLHKTLVLSLSQYNYGMEHQSLTPGNSMDETTTFTPALGPKQSYLMHRVRCFFGVKRLEYETEHSHPPSAEVRMCGVPSPIPHASSWHVVAA
jgi:hypothetical protein